MIVHDKFAVDDKIMVTMIGCYCFNNNSFISTTLIMPPLFLISYYCQLLKQVETWQHPYLHKPFESEQESQNFIVSRMIFLTMLLCVLHTNCYITNMDLSVLVIEKAVMKRQQTQLYNFFIKSEDLILVASNCDN